MIDAAERIVAERGMPAMTLKDVQIAANQANKSAAKYHFGSRDGLIEAVIESRMAPVNTRRQELLDEITRTGEPTVRRSVEALLRPLAAETLGRPGSHYARFLAQSMLDPALADTVQRHLRAESYWSAKQLMIDLAPVPHEVALWRADNVMMLGIVTLAAREGRDRTAAETSALIADLIDTCVAVLEAPSSTPVPIDPEESPTADSEGVTP
ncbi:TetR/AcrR family transcriptional regulator [Prescottella agglutinans]|uniref:TetR/AcrR family transcriptional regulator n=1 Tax=Prescottella agglutinans TaxID=1644129 RepID=A0A438BI49_9NOCA|nr:TetR/AcrR family transcriptional regulator [Prescottella agglutinans]RVW10441.1 TetR/AcrR family transcriptional regulator [Prescottella agglutinans]